MTPNDLDMFKVTNTNMHVTCMPAAQIFVVSLYDNPFLSTSNGTIFRKVHRIIPNDVDMFKVKNTKINATYTSEAQIFVGFALQ